MNNKQKQKIIENAKSFFRDEIVQNHINSACQRASKLSSYNINPFLYKYLANFLTGNDKPESIAKALVLPRILGTSINTSFGMKIQSLISSLFEGLGSTTQGIDIEFIDEIDKRKKYCQLKAGPNTINKDDVVTIVNHFNGVRNLARTKLGIFDLQNNGTNVFSDYRWNIIDNHYSIEDGQTIIDQYPIDSVLDIGEESV